MSAYEKPTGTYDVFGVLAQDQYHVSLGYSLVVPEPHLLEGLCIQQGESDIPQHGDSHKDVYVCIGGVPYHVLEPSKETERPRHPLLSEILRANFTSINLPLQLLLCISNTTISLGNGAVENIVEEFMIVADSFDNKPSEVDICNIIRQRSTSSKTAKETISILSNWEQSVASIVV